VKEETDFDRGVRLGIEAAAQLIERVRCRTWKPTEAAWQIRTQLAEGRLDEAIRELRKKEEGK
jgi:hypothetical protein